MTPQQGRSCMFILGHHFFSHQDFAAVSLVSSSAVGVGGYAGRSRRIRANTKAESGEHPAKAFTLE